jgi:diacylglycerol kinase family enzyme
LKKTITMMPLSIAPVLLAAMVMVLPKTTVSWTAPIVARKKPTATTTTTTTNGGSRFDGPYHRRCFLLPPTESSIDSVGFAFSSSPLSLSSSTTALWSTKRNEEIEKCSHENTNINGTGVDKNNIEISYSNKDTENTIFVETEHNSKLRKTTAKAPLLPSPPTSTEIQEIAIVLNTNAKGVTEDLIEAARDVVEQHREIERRDSSTTNSNSNGNGKSNTNNLRVRLLVTSTYDEAKSASRDIVATASAAAATTMVVPVGGDGTLTAMINLLWEEYRAANTIEQRATARNNNSSSSDVGDENNFPFVFGYVAMGTGNALGSVVGCLPVAPKPIGGRHQKRKRVLRFFRRCLRPRNRKRDDFHLVLSQLIEAAAQTQTQTQTTGKHGVGEEKTPVRLNPLEVDMVELPLIRVRTTQGGAGLGNGNGRVENKNDDRYAFFAGLGYDSVILQDYKDLQDWRKAKNHRQEAALWQVATTGVVGYTVAMMTRSLPKLLRLKDASKLLRDVRITTDDPGSTYWIDHRRGDTMRPAIDNINIGGDKEGKAAKGLLYRGSAGIIAAGTVPYYGGGLRLFPFARMTPGGMNLRIGRQLHPLEGIAKIPSIFEGSFRDRTTDTFQCLDFVGHQFTIEIYDSYKDDGTGGSSGSYETEEGFPVQHSGEAMGSCTRVEFTVSSPEVTQRQHPNYDHDPTMPPPMRFVTLMSPRLVEERIDIDP